MTTAGANRPPKQSSWPFAVGILALLVFLGFLPLVIAKTRFTYTPSDKATATRPKFDMDRAFPLLMKQGAPVSLKELTQGHPGGVIVNFWATWCPPCIEELPSLEELDRQLKAKADPLLPKLVTVSVDAHAQEVAALYRTLPFRPGFLVLHDPDAAFAESLGSEKFPETYWIAPDGTVKYKWLGPQDWTAQSVLQVLARRDSAHQPIAPSNP